MQKSLLRRLYDLLHADGARIISILDVFCYSAVKKYRFLRYNSNLRPQEWYINTM